MSHNKQKVVHYLEITDNVLRYSSVDVPENKSF